MKTKIILLIFLLVPFLDFGWGAKGHKMVADIAKENLNAGVEKKIQSFLGDMSFEEASVWMDSMRADHSYNYMSPWHYLDIDSGATYVENPKGDIVSELNRVIKELRNYRNMSHDSVALDLRILFHLCGDITQPLHCGYGSDKGGNTVKVNCNGKETTLHHVWDSDIINSVGITTPMCLASMKFCPPAQQKEWEKIDVMQWMADSRSYLPQVYKYGPNGITQDYIQSNTVIIEQQICKGGLRLAAVLNDIFKD